MTAQLTPCPGCGRTTPADDGHAICRRCEGVEPLYPNLKKAMDEGRVGVGTGLPEPGKRTLRCPTHGKVAIGSHDQMPYCPVCNIDLDPVRADLKAEIVQALEGYSDDHARDALEQVAEALGIEWVRHDRT